MNPKSNEPAPKKARRDLADEISSSLPSSPLGLEGAVVDRTGTEDDLEENKDKLEKEQTKEKTQESTQIVDDAQQNVLSHFEHVVVPETVAKKTSRLVAPLHRNWLEIADVKTDEDLTIVSYNVSGRVTDAELTLLQQELKSLEGDVICIQRIHADSYSRVILPYLIKLGYQGVYSAYNDASQKAGLATFVKANRFVYKASLTKNLESILAKLGAREENQGSDIVKTAAVMQVTDLVSRSSHHYRLRVLNYELFDVDVTSAIAIIQVFAVMKEAAAYGSVAVICSDLGVAPDSVIYKVLTGGSIPTSFAPLTQEGAFRDIPGFKSAYGGFSKTVSNVQSCKVFQPVGPVLYYSNYIWVLGDARVTGVLDIPDEWLAQTDSDQSQGSCHISLASKLTIGQYHQAGAFLDEHETGAVERDFSHTSAEELISEITAIFERLNKLEEFTETSTDLSNLHLIAKHVAKKEMRERVGQKLSELKAPELFRKIWNKHFMDDFLVSDRPFFKNMYDSLTVISIMTEESLTFAKHSFRIKLHTDILTYLSSATLDPVKTKAIKAKKLVIELIHTLYNLVQQVSRARQSLRDSGAVNMLQRFHLNSDEKTSCNALILQACLVTDDESEQIHVDDSTFDFLIRLLRTALSQLDHYAKTLSLSAIDVLSAINLLAANDNNKSRIIKSGALPCYVTLLQQSCSTEEQACSTKGLWTLAFNCKDEILNEPGCVDAIRKLTLHTNETVKRQAKGILWVLKGPEKKTPTPDNIPVPVQHVFISYQWNSKDLALIIRDRLKVAGYRVWIDIDNMAGSVLEAMADAVEKAVVVLVCLTQKYKESPNCRTEAEYTFRLQKKVVPIRLQAGYVPDGWLGALIGSQLVHDFSGDITDHTFEDLYRDLGDRGKESGGDGRIFGSASPAPTTKANVNIWTTTDVKDWLVKSKLDHLCDWFQEIDGPLLLELKAMRLEAADSFFAMLMKNESFKPVDMLRLSRLLKQI